MKKLFWIFILFIAACSPTEPPQEKSKPVIKFDTIEDASVGFDSSAFKPHNYCEINYDTVRNERYKFHVRILQIIDGRFKPDDQMVAQFFNLLDPEENAFYALLTNKVIYALLEKLPAKLINHNKNLISKKQYEYFLSQIAHPKCYKLSLVKIKEKFIKEFPEETEDQKEKKAVLLEQIQSATYVAFNALETTPFGLLVVLKCSDGDSRGIKLELLKNGRIVKTVVSDGSTLELALVLNAAYLIKCSKPGFVTKVVSFDTNVPPGREQEEFAQFTVEVNLIKALEGEKTEPSAPVGGVAYSETTQDFEVVGK